MRAFYLLSFIVYAISCNSYVSQTHQKLQAKHKLKNGNVVSIYSVEGSATTNEAIIINNQIRNRNLLIDIFERYDTLKSSRMLNDSCLQIVIKNTKSSWNELDTFIVNVSKYHPIGSASKND